VATTAGVLLGLAPLLAFAGLAVWGVTFFVARYVSVASIAAALSVPILAFAVGESWPVKVLAIAGAAAVVVLHRANLQRLRRGKEPRVRLRAVFSR
jgi:glycerol-3-phosphate acyltransferase PlsY